MTPREDQYSLRTSAAARMDPPSAATTSQRRSASFAGLSSPREHVHASAESVAGMPALSGCETMPSTAWRLANRRVPPIGGLGIWLPGLDILALPSLRDVITHSSVSSSSLAGPVQDARAARPGRSVVGPKHCLLHRAAASGPAVVARSSQLPSLGCAKGLPRNDRQTRRGRGAKTSAGRQSPL
jgi:hypothetical protein